ncbi:MaoC family dehydratase [Pseudonocardia saturnea]
MSHTASSLAEMKALVGEHLGYSEWHEVTQDRVDTFADATDDHQWIHTDPERAETGPFKGPIAHGYLTLSLLTPLWGEVLKIDGIAMMVNYGLSKVRFTAPVPVGSKIRLGATLVEVKSVHGGIDASVDCIVEVQGAPKPALIAQPVYRYYV